jgi:aryl sulfotransferase
MTDITTRPRKTRELQTRLFDSTIWNDFQFRDDDIIIATHPKAGTTWMQQIVAQLLFRGDPHLEVGRISPWLDHRLPPKAEKLATIEAQTHRRVLKTHLPLDALVFSPRARYIYVARDGRDVVWSWHNHLLNMSQAFRDRLNNLPGGVGPPMAAPTPDIRQFWRNWLDRDGFGGQSFWMHLRTWWAVRDLPNVLMIHYAKLKEDLSGEICRVATFLDIPIDPTRWDAILEYCSFDWMKANATKSAVGVIDAWEGGPQVFFHRGTNGRWSEVLSEEEIAEYDARAMQELGPACARWLASGELP